MLILKGVEMRRLDELNWLILLVIGAMLMFAPFTSTPHLVEKLGMLRQGTLVNPTDIFDLLMHSFPLLLIILKAARQFLIKNKL
jgi:hypothetical protein